MANGACDICGRPATARVRASVNGRVQNMELCDQHYREMARRSGRSASPLESLFGRRSLLDEFFGESGFGSLFGDSPLRGGTLGSMGDGDDAVVDATFGEGAPRRGSRRGGGRTIADRLSEQGNKLLQDAAQKAGEFGRSEVDTEHLLLALTSSDVVKTILEQFKVDVDDLRRQIEKEAKRGEAKTEGEIGVSPRLKDALNRAFIASNELGHSYVGPEHLLIGLAEEGEGLAASILRKYGLTPQALRQQVTKVVGKGAEEGRVEAPSSTPDLDQFSRDLTKLAREGKLDPVIGRAREIETTIEVLARRKKNNPVLIGEPGVGKTAIVEGLAQRIVAGEVPEALRDKRLVELNINSMVAGSKYRGEFEERVQKILKEITEEKDSLILFIDEIHTIVGAGQGGGEGGLDIANTFKPALARGELNLIGATTLNEYQKYIEKDAALERRFQPVYVEEPTVAQVIMILRGLRDTLEAHHKVTITDEAIVAAAELSDRYITGRFMPDKAIDLIDQAAARVKISATARPVDVQELEAEAAQIKREQDYAAARKQFDRAAELKKELEQKQKELDELLEIWKRDQASATAEVRADHVAQIVSKITGVPVTELTTEEKDKLLKLEEKLHERVIGQEEAIRAVADAVRLARAGLREGSGPTATFLFLGPTGVGKTELAKTLAEVIFGDQDAMIRIDMSEYGERHSVARLVGAPPGYVGYDEGGPADREGAPPALLGRAARRDREGASGCLQHPASGVRRWPPDRWQGPRGGLHQHHHHRHLEPRFGHHPAQPQETRHQGVRRGKAEVRTDGGVARSFPARVHQPDRRDHRLPFAEPVGDPPDRRVAAQPGEADRPRPGRRTRIRCERRGSLRRGRLPSRIRRPRAAPADPVGVGDRVGSRNALRADRGW